MQKDTNIKLIFIRHAQHEGATTDADLTDKGLDEVEELVRKVKINPRQCIGFSPNNFRSLLTTYAIIHRKISNELLNSFHRNTRKRIIIDNNLCYKDPTQYKPFFEKLDFAYKQKNIFRFLIDESDKYRDKEFELVTTNKTMCNYLAKLILKHCKIMTRWRYASRTRIDKTLYRIICSQEYYLPCFRAEITKILLGENESKKYVNWYINNLEYKDNGRTEVAEVNICIKDRKLVLTLNDSYGELYFDQESVTKILKL